MELILFYLVLAVVVGVAASARDRSGGGWFLLAVITSPLIAGVLVLLLPNRRRERLDRERHLELLRAVNPDYQSAAPQIGAMPRVRSKMSPVDDILGQKDTSSRLFLAGPLIAIGIIAVIVYIAIHNG